MNSKFLLAIVLPTSICLAATSSVQAANPDQVQRRKQTNQCPACDLSGADLSQVNLFGANLVNANLSGANLQGANLGSANLTDANLSNAKLNDAFLHQATLEQTNFSNADLTNAYLRDALIVNTTFTGATLRGVNLSRTNLAGVNFAGIDLSDANLSGTVMMQVMLPGMTPRSDMSTMGLLFAAMTPMGNACDRGLVPEEAKRQGFRVEIANLTSANLQGANLSSALLPYVDLSNANLSNANLTNTILTCGKLNNVNLAGADLKDARLTGAVLEGTDPKAAKNANLEGSFATAAAVTQAPIQNEAKQYVGSMNRAQQAYYLENNRFAAQLNQLGLGIQSDTEHYKYRIFTYPDRERAVMLAGVPRRGGFKTYIGLVNVTEQRTFAMLCESVEAKPLLPKLPTSLPTSGAMTCPEGFAVVGP